VVVHAVVTRVQIKNAGGLAKWPAPYGDWVPADPNNKVSNSLCGSYNYIANVLQAVQLATALNNSQDAANLAQVSLPRLFCVTVVNRSLVPPFLPAVA
jgi:hypothetical protein